MSNHTPGPWKVAPYSSVVGCPITAQPDPTKNTILIAGTRSAVSTDDEGFRSEVEANARLIAAAPDLLASLQNLEFYVRDSVFGNSQVATAARAAIAKAKGTA
jgi:hypothetical protein